MDYQKCAKEILGVIGGKDNLVSAAHCATRLRLVIADNGQNIWMPIATAANVAQGAAALAVGIKTHNRKIKSMALPASLSAFMGITEPAIFGVNVRFVKPLIAGMIGGAFGAAVASIMSVYATANGVTVIFGFLITTDSFLGYILQQPVRELKKLRHMGEKVYSGDKKVVNLPFEYLGTNDLTQYTLACDRQNAKLEEFVDTHHEAVLRLIELSAKNAHAGGAWIGICGELAADLTLTETFLKMGIDELSVSPPFVLPLREKVRSIKL